MEPFNEKLQVALQLRREEKLQQSNLLLLELTTQNPNNAYLLYQCAWSFDCLGEETKAVPYYVKAISAGLAGEDLENAYLGLGSTYRALGEYEKSRAVFADALNLFPHNEALRVFYAMTLYNVNEHQAAMELLLTCIAETSSDSNVQKYKRALQFYANKLDETWT